MVTVKVKSNFQSVIKDLAKLQAKREKAIKDTLEEITITAFKEIESKSVTNTHYEKGKFYTSPPEANIPKFINTKTGKKLTKKQYFSSTKIITRSGELLESIKRIAQGAKSSTDYVIKITKNKLEIFAITSKAIVLEVKKAGNKSPRNIIKKTFRRAVNIFRKTLTKELNK